MQILGLVSMPKGGKGVVVDTLKNDGWTHISMSSVLRDHMMHDLLPWVAEEVDQGFKPSRRSYFKSSHHYRKQEHPGILAQWCLEEVQKLPPEQRQRVIIDGIRHPSEIKYLLSTGEKVQVWGLIADQNFEKDQEIRRARFEQNSGQRGEGFEFLDEFDWIDFLEKDMPEYGNQVEKCLSMVQELDKTGEGRIIINNGKSKEDYERFQCEIQGVAQSLNEGRAGFLERR